MTKIKTVHDLEFDTQNFNKGNEQGKALIKKSISEHGTGRSILVDKNGKIIAGNKTTENFKELGFEKVKIVKAKPDELIAVQRDDIDLDSPQGRAMALADNKTSEANLEWDFEMMQEELPTEMLEDWGIELPEQEIDANKDVKQVKLADKFIVPPFSILDTRQGYWKERKNHWKALIQDNGETRDMSGQSKSRYRNLSAWENKPYKGYESKSNVSVLDPVLAEIVNKWFGLPKCNTFDPFAGDSVFGYTSDYLGNTFTGIELRKEQADINNQRLKGSKSKYLCDDGQNILKHIKEKSQDLLFSCPPYFDLEVYSDLPTDASNQKEYKDFLQILDNTFTDSIKCLKDDRFAVITVGDLRNKKGFYYRFVDDIKDIFKKSDVFLLNELILIQSIGNAMLRAGSYMTHRKVAKVHEQVLVFYKGNPKKIKEIYPKLDFSEIENNQDEGTDV